MLCVSDELATRYAADPEGRIKILTEAQADSWLAQNKQLAEQPEEEIEDPNRMLAILAKQAAGVPLTDADRDAVDPDKKEKGIRRKKKTCKEIFGV